MTMPLVFMLVIFTGVVLGKPIINALKRLNARQTIYEYAPETHRAKEGTPTMGGFIILIAVALGCIARIFVPGSDDTSLAPFLILSVAVLFALLGFADDYLMKKWTGRRGLEWKSKLVLQFGLAALSVFMLSSLTTGETNTDILQADFSQANAGRLAFLTFWMVAWINAFNLTDGLDGLAASLSAIAFIGMGGIVAFPAPLIDTAMVWAGACLGYLWWNAYPARVFMGDTGSMALGAAFGSLSAIPLLRSNAPLSEGVVWILLGGVFVAEIVSVVIQLSWVKLFKKRLFRATPIHHHFERLQWHETQIVARFVIVGILFLSLAIWEAHR